MRVDTPEDLGTLGKLIFAAMATPAVLRASVRLLQHREKHFSELADTMRSTRPFQATGLRRPAYLAALVERLAFLLPPFGYGPCFKTSLLLLDLWSRCGLEPRLHLGTVSDRRDRHFHAWVTCGSNGPQTSSSGHQEIWSG